MGRIAVVNFISIDGVIQSPISADEDPSGGFARGGWTVPYADDAVAAYMSAATTGAAAMLLGRRSYEILAAAWSDADQSDEAVAAMNRMTKYVVSRSLSADDLGWAPSRLIKDVRSIATVKDDVDGEIVVFGSGDLIRSLAEDDLVDEYRLLLFPVVLGDGRRMFGGSSPLTRFTLKDSTTSPSGVVMLTWTR